MKRALAVLMILCLLVTGALAKNILPSLDVITTDVLPSMSNALLRTPSRTETLQNGDQRQIYVDVTEEEYERCGEYLGDQGCEAKSNRPNKENGTMIVELSHGGHSFTMRYDAQNRTLEMTYPKGTAPATDALFRPGSSVFFGHYGEGGDALIEWGVLANDGVEATLISMRALDAQPYNESKVNVNWQDSTLRYYLNTTFSGEAFTAEERKRLKPDGEDDVVRLPGVEEAAALFADSAARRCSAADDVTKLVQSEGACRWWLRGTDTGLNAPIVDEGGNILKSGDGITRVIGVRPMVVFDVIDIDTAYGDYGAVGTFKTATGEASAPVKAPTATPEAAAADESEQEMLYNTALNLFEEGSYAEAEEIFLKLDDYGESVFMAGMAGKLKPTPSPEELAAAQLEKVNAAKYEAALKLYDAERYEEAEAAFRSLGDYADSALMAETAALLKPTPTPTAPPTPTPTPTLSPKEIEAQAREAENAAVYEDAQTLFEAERYAEAEKLFAQLGDYKDSAAMARKCARLKPTPSPSPEEIAAEKLARENEEQYRKALLLLEQKSYSKAAELFGELGDYRDSPTKAQVAANLMVTPSPKPTPTPKPTPKPTPTPTPKPAYKPGDIVTFGHYEQDGNSANGAEPIEWQVLENDGESVKLISVKGLDAKPYNNIERRNVTWKTCTLRKWLNSDFLNAAFTVEEQARLVETRVSADKNPNFDTNPGNDTWDRVWLLSIPEAEKYFKNDESRICYPTKSAVNNGVWKDSKGARWWWLRSPGYVGNFAAIVDVNGSVYSLGFNVYYGNEAVRPVVSLRLS